MAFTRVHNQIEQSKVGDSHALTPTTNPSAGNNLIIFGVVWDSAVADINDLTVTDDGSNTWTIQIRDTPESDQHIFLAYLNDLGTGGALTITVQDTTLGGSPWWNVGYCEYAGGDLTPVVAKILTNADLSGTRYTSDITSAGEELIIGYLTHEGNSGALTQSGSNPSGWNDVMEIEGASQGQPGAFQDHLGSPSAALTHAGWTQGGGAAGGNSALFIAAFTEASTGTNYNETGRSVSVVATVSSADTIDFSDTGRSVAVIGTVASADTADFTDTARLVAITATVTAQDTADFDETGRSVAITATVSSTDVLAKNYDETGRTVSVVVSTSSTDVTAFTDSVAVAGVVTVTSTDLIDFTDDVSVSVASTVTSTDLGDFTDTGLTVAIATTVSSTDTFNGTNFDETGRTVAIVASVSIIDTANWTDTGLVVAAIATVSTTDIANWVDTNLPVSIVATVSSTDVYSAGGYDETGRAVAIVVTVTATEEHFYIPGYNGNPDVGLLTPRSTKTGYAAYTGGDLNNAGVVTISQKIIQDLQVSGNTQLTIDDCFFQDRLLIDTGATVTITDTLFEASHPSSPIKVDDNLSLLYMTDCEINRPSGGPSWGQRGFAVQGKSNTDRSLVKRVLFTTNVGTGAARDGAAEDAGQPWGNVDVIMFQVKRFDATHGALSSWDGGGLGSPHGDALQTSADNVTIGYCNLDAMYDVGTLASSVASFYSDFGDVDNYELHHSYLNAAGTLLDITEKPAGVLSDVRVHNNIFGPDYNFNEVLFSTDLSTYPVITQWENNTRESDQSTVPNPEATPPTYDETGRQVNIVASIASTDVAAFTENVSVAIVASISSTDSVPGQDETGRPVSIVATVTATDTWGRYELGLPVNVSATITSTEIFGMTDDLFVDIVVGIAINDTAFFLEALLLSILAEVSSLDLQGPSTGMGSKVSSSPMMRQTAIPTMGGNTGANVQVGTPHHVRVSDPSGDIEA